MNASPSISIRRVLTMLGMALIIAMVGFAGYSWSETIVKTEATETMATGARHLTIKVGSHASLQVVCFTEDKFKLLVVSNPKPEKDRKLAGVAEANKAIAGCNGGYFKPGEMTPFGLEVAEGVSTGAWANGGQFAAAFGVRNDKAFVAFEKDITVSPDFTGLVQAGPLLVDDQWTFENTSAAAVQRTFVMTDGNGQWALGVGDRFTLNELAKTLARPGLIEGFKVRRAMNLDGGPSTGFWWQGRDGKAHSQPERWRVRNMVLVVPR